MLIPVLILVVCFIVFLLAPGADEADEQQPTSLSGDA